jgi:uncharacterized protein (TIGR02246 family)
MVKAIATNSAFLGQYAHRPKSFRVIKFKMKTTSTTIAAVLLLTAAFFTLAPSAVAATLSKEDDQGIRKTVTGIEESWNAHDMKAFGKLLREDAEWINVVGMHWHGRDAVVKAHAIFHEIMFKDCRLKTDAIEIRALGGDHAIAVVTTTQDSFTTPDGHVMPKGQTKQSYVLAKESNGWKIVHAQNVRVDAEAVKNDPVNSHPK